MRSGEMFDDDSQKIIDRFGASNPKLDPTGRRKQANEGRLVNHQFTGDFAQQRQRGDLQDYQTRSFWGRKDYAQQVYGGDTDGGRFLRQAREGAVSAREGRQGSRDDGRVFSTGQIDRAGAREASAATIGRPSDAETDFRREVFPQPEVKLWRPKRALEVQDTREMLGR